MATTLDDQTPARADEFLGKHADYNFIFFLGGILVLLFALPTIEWFSTGRTAYALSLFVVAMAVVLASWTFRVRRGLFMSGIALACAAFLLALGSVALNSDPLGYLSLVPSMAFWLLGAWIAGTHVLAAGPVTFNRIVGSVCIYMMVGVVFADLNVLVNWLLPESFNNLQATGQVEEMTEFLYYSFVTLNTLGFGYIAPTGTLARVLAILESTFGVFYLAILVAALVGMKLASYTAPAPDDDEPGGSG